MQLEKENLDDSLKSQESECITQSYDSHCFERMSRALPCVLYDYQRFPDGSNKCLFVSAHCQNLFEIPAEKMMEDLSNFWDMVHPDDIERMIAEDAHANITESSFSIEIRIITPSGKTKWVYLSSQPNTPMKGQPAIWSGFVFDITAQKKTEEELEYLATTDTLTAIPNRRGLIKKLKDELERYHRTYSPASLMILDLDFFKQVNDKYGHNIGDSVLQHFTTIVKHNLRSIDTFGRLGGEEFCIILPDTPLEGGYSLATRLCKIVEVTPLRLDETVINYTTSIGVTLFNENDYSAEPILERADAALYRAKVSGRNQAVC